MGDIRTTKPLGKEQPVMHSNDVDHNEIDGDEPELTDTVFIRNLARFDTTQESLKEYIEKNFGPTVYCLICKDKETGESKGTAFVKFKSIETAEKCLEEYEDPENQTKFFLDGRNLFVLPALTRDKISEVKRAVAPTTDVKSSKKKKKPRHNRARPPISESASTFNSPRPQKSKKSQNKESHKTKGTKDSIPIKKGKIKGDRKPKNKPTKTGSDHKTSGMKKVKKNTGKEKKKAAKKRAAGKPRGRH